MCGICGVYRRSSDADDHRPLLKRMTESLRHRGPDGAGEFVSDEVGLGHRRLSIIDVAGGAQPIDNEDGTIQLVFNGEIYNHLEVREELESLGHRFKTRSDSEVIVHGYEQWGRDCVQHFNGMFAFAIWDACRRELLLARDHLGIKPLYYVDVGARVLFASEIRALLRDPACPREVDVSALGDMFTFRYVPSPKTLFKGIKKLPPGHVMTVSPTGVSLTRFWTWTPKDRRDGREEELIEEYQGLLADAVRLQLRSDVPVGLFLSSGVDSGALLALMSQSSSQPVRAFTLGFEGGVDSEVEDAGVLAKMFGATHESMVITPEDYRAYYARYMSDLEEPVGNETAAAFYFLSRMTSGSVKVALTGQGADEPWAGYHRHIGVRLSDIYSRLPARMTHWIGRSLDRVPGRFERLKRGADALGEPDVLTRFAKVYSFFSSEMKSQLFAENLKNELANQGHIPSRALAHLQSDVQGLDALSQMLYIDTRASLPDDLLMVGDKMSMANSLEVRVPYLDYRLIEFIESLPPHMKLKNLTGKYLHKRALEKWLPREIVWRKKKGFANPVDRWFRDRMRPFVEECLLAPDSASALFFDQSYIRRMLFLDRTGREQYRRHLYLLVSFELWYNTFIRH